MTIRSIYTILVLFLLIVSSCKKENSSYSTFPDKTVGTAVKARHEILASASVNNGQPGKLLIYNYDNAFVNQVTTNYTAINFQRWLIEGCYYYSYFQLDPTAYQIPDVPYAAGQFIILDENLSRIDKVGLLPYNGRSSADIAELDLHEFILLGRSHYIGLAYQEQQVSNIPATLNPDTNVRVVNCIIQEVKNGQVIFEWNATDYPEFYTSSVQSNDFSDVSKVQDYLHVNGISIDPTDGHLIVSARNTDQVFKLNRNTGAVMWRLGGKNSDFPLTDQQKFYRQHNATITDNGKTLLLFDNGVAGTREYSRIVEFNLDHTGKTVSAFKATSVPYNLFCAFMGSVQKTDSSYFIGCGSVPRILEVNYNTLEVTRDIQLTVPSYRSYIY